MISPESLGVLCLPPPGSSSCVSRAACGTCSTDTGNRGSGGKAPMRTVGPDGPESCRRSAKLQEGQRGCSRRVNHALARWSGVSMRWCPREGSQTAKAQSSTVGWEPREWRFRLPTRRDDNDTALRPQPPGRRLSPPTDSSQPSASHQSHSSGDTPAASDNGQSTAVPIETGSRNGPAHARRLPAPPIEVAK